jgi:hypothetical protein
MAATAATLGERALRRLGVAIVPLADRPGLDERIAPATIAADALVKLGVISAEEVPSPDDQALSLAAVRAVQDSLIAQAIVWWDNTGIPRAVREEYISLAALSMAMSFGKPTDLQQVALLETRIRRMALVLSSPDIATKAIHSVHADLAARGRVRWSIEDIPAAAEQPYVVLAAFQMAPLFEQQPVPTDAALAQRQLAQIIALPTSGERVQVEYF